MLDMILALALMAAEPHAVIEGPSIVEANRSILLDARRSVSDRPLRWKLLGDQGRPFLTFDKDGRSDVFAFVPEARPGDRYVFLLVAKGVPEGGKPEDIDLDAAVFEVAVKQQPLPPTPTPTPPTPTPTPTPIPPGPAPTPDRFGLAALVRSTVLGAPGLTADQRTRGAQALAGVYRAGAAQVAAGAITTPADLARQTGERTVAALGADYPAWKAAMAPAFARLMQLYTAGTIGTVQDMAVAWTEIATGLEGVR